MATCTACGQVILFGGVKSGDIRFCSETCRQKSNDVIVAQLAQEYLSDEMIEEPLAVLHQSDCPCCGGRGPVDFHYSYQCLSFLVITRFQKIPKLSCRSCAAWAKWKNLFLTGLFGWWGIPWGIIVTPVYIGKNLFGLVFPPSSDTPSKELREFVRATAMSHILEQQSEQQEGNE